MIASTISIAVVLPQPNNNPVLRTAATQLSERVRELVQKTMDTKNDTKETVDHDVKHNRVAS